LLARGIKRGSEVVAVNRAHKSTGRERYGAPFVERWRAELDVLSFPDAVATLTALTVRSVAAAVGSRDTFAAIGLLAANRDVFNRAAPDADKQPDLAPKVVLDGVKDNRPLLGGGKEEEEYCDLLVQASKLTAKAFANTARKDITFAHMFEEPAQYRGEVVHVPSDRIVVAGAMRISLKGLVS